MEKYHLQLDIPSCNERFGLWLEDVFQQAWWIMWPCSLPASAIKGKRKRSASGKPPQPLACIHTRMRTRTWKTDRCPKHFAHSTKLSGVTVHSQVSNANPLDMPFNVLLRPSFMPQNGTETTPSSHPANRSVVRPQGRKP